jgi:hypothetical protein
MPQPALLVVALGHLTTSHLESRIEPDTSGFEFTVTNLATSLVKLTKIKLTLAFDFSSSHLTINEKSKSVPGSDAVEIEVADLEPGQLGTVSLKIDANVSGNQSPAASYPLTILAAYDAEPFPKGQISGGAQVFSVVPD